MPFLMLGEARVDLIAEQAARRLRRWAWSTP
jgi:hypothetical protein